MFRSVYEQNKELNILIKDFLDGIRLDRHRPNFVDLTCKPFFYFKVFLEKMFPNEEISNRPRKNNSSVHAHQEKFGKKTTLGFNQIFY